MTGYIQLNYLFFFNRFSASVLHYTVHSQSFIFYVYTIWLKFKLLNALGIFIIYYVPVRLGYPGFNSIQQKNFQKHGVFTYR